MIEQHPVRKYITSSLDMSKYAIFTMNFGENYLQNVIYRHKIFMIKEQCGVALDTIQFQFDNVIFKDKGA